MANIKQLYEDKERTKPILPKTSTKAVVDDNGVILESRLGQIVDLLNQKQMSVGAVPSDLTPKPNSNNWATSGGIWSESVYSENDFILGEHYNFGITAGGKWWQNGTTSQCYITSVSDGDAFTIKANSNFIAQYAWLNSASPVHDQDVDFVTGENLHEIGIGEEIVVIAPAGTKYLYITQYHLSDLFMPNYIRIVKTIKKEVADIDKKRYIDVDESLYANITFGIDPNNGKWLSMSTNRYSKVIPIPNGVRAIKLTPTSSLMMYSLLSKYDTPSNNTAAYIATGFNARYTASTEMVIDKLNDAKFLCVRADVGTDAECPEVYFAYSTDYIVSELFASDRYEVKKVGIENGFYIDHTDGIVKSASSQRGNLYKVKKGDELLIIDTDYTLMHRYGILHQYPSVGLTADLYGLENALMTVIISPVDGYLMINQNASYPTVTVFNIHNHVDRVKVQQELDNMAVRFGYKLNIDTTYLSSKTSATISNGVVTISSGGSAKSAYSMMEDEILINANIKPTADTFDIRFGKYNTTNGTLVGLRNDGTTSYVDLYKGTTKVASITLDFTLANGVTYFVSLRKITCDNTYVELNLDSDNGYNYHAIIATPEQSGSDVDSADMTYLIGKMWGVIYCAANLGSCELSNLNVYSPYKQNCKVVVLGHSFVEGNSIEGMKMKKFAKILQSIMGMENCGIFGQGGATMANCLSLLRDYVKAFYTPQYVLVCTGTNDNTMTLANFKTWQNNIISQCSSINATPVFFTIPPDGGSYEGEWASINAYLRNGANAYVDMDKCFTNNGTPVAARYLYDNTHPNPETHRAIFERILQDVPTLIGW